MCGIVGVTGVPDAARAAYLGLYSLRHRGQESGGMGGVNGEGVARSHRGMGLVSDVFSERVLGELPGDVAIGHTRYSTAGTSVLANAQPMLAGYREGPLALAHNGNLTNAASLRADLVAKGSIFQTSSDSEVLIHLIARSEAREPEDQLLDALERVEGAYSLAVTLGRALYTIFGRSVDRVRRALGRELAREHPAPQTDCVFSVPDSSNAMALGFAEEAGLKLEHALIRNHYVGRTFINPTQDARNAKVKIKFN